MVHRGVVLLVVLIAAARAEAAPVDVTGEPVAAAPATAGDGLCTVSAMSSNPGADFGFTVGTYRAGINAFVDASGGAAAALATEIDESNSDTAGTGDSAGDFLDAITGCPSYGCAMPFNDTTTSFAQRVRGFVAVAPAQVGQSMHFGVYCDDAVSVTIFDGAGVAYDVVVRPPQLGQPTWRSTNTVTFEHAGLYAIEVLYVQIAEHAALELSMYGGAFTDFELPANQIGSVDLAGAGFTLAPRDNFYRDEDGTVGTTCAECARADAGQGIGSCGAGNWCNGAALCEACDTDARCGATCAPCDTDETCIAGACIGPPDAGVPPDAVSSPDASNAAEGGDGGCCDTSGTPAPGALLLALFTAATCAGATRRRRRGGRP